MIDKVKIAVIDSGVHINHPFLSERPVTGLKFYEQNGIIQYENCISDANGHGTAVAGIIFDKCPEVSMLSIGVLDMKLKCKFNVLKAALQYAIDNGVDMINLSLGTVMEKYKPELELLCMDAERKGILIVSAISNTSTTSYPARFPNVFGVSSKYIRNKYGYVFEADELNVYANGFQQKVFAKDGTHAYVSGNSFASAHFCGILAGIIYSEGRKDRDFITEQLSKRSLELSQIQNDRLSNRKLEIEKGLLFPINDENIERIRLHQEGDPEIVGFYDFRPFCCNYYPIATPSGHKDVRIFEDLGDGLQEADALLIGDIGFLTPETQEALLRDLVTRAIKLGKNVLIKDALYPDIYTELYELARQKGTFIKTRYI